MVYPIKSLLLALGLAFVSNSILAADPVRVATTTSTYNSGLLDYLLPEFEKETGLRVQVLSVGTGQALRLGQDGDVDLVITHAPEAEEAFVELGHGVDPRGLMYNDYILVGPRPDRLNLYEAEGILDALEKIHRRNAPFISRGDDSGTYNKEKELWERSGLKPNFSRYQAVGQGMGRVLIMSNELQAYTLADRGTWLAMQSRLKMQIVYEGGIDLANPYQVILVNPARHTSLNHQEAKKLRDWLVSPRGQSLINNFTIEGEQLFFGDAE
ncbi:tungstate transport system substrate-binding protein [Marinospirillum celere]|uniref:Tungstate transport system substrate-binding protein n=1 Tax=Marinospirillum celere TaxID=1122252 RepID=A0A1I1JRU8_9GAMM|nr:substrate-binding domain-containing protein [Marinospirillum celere]SFC50941.1 tungstate transport system substrate-binding protein [Marinospirillum celere]